jgi:hypothetical protein
MNTLTTLRTPAEIVGRIRNKNDVFGFTGDVLARYLTAEHVREFCKPDADLSSWKTTPLDRETILAEMRDYMTFAWEKCNNQRGLSANRSVLKMAAWLWLLGDDEAVAFAEDDSHYAMYGRPVLTYICQRYGFPIE